MFKRFFSKNHTKPKLYEDDEYGLYVETQEDYDLELAEEDYDEILDDGYLEFLREEQFEIESEKINLL